MYARNVTLHLKANAAPEFTRTLETDVLPLLRKQNGFKEVVEGTPQVEVANSTFHKIAARN